MKSHPMCHPEYGSILRQFQKDTLGKEFARIRYPVFVKFAIRKIISSLKIIHAKINPIKVNPFYQIDATLKTLTFQHPDDTIAVGCFIYTKFMENFQN